MNNKKLMISLFSLCLVAIVGLLTTVIVLAAGTQNVNSSVKITYTATDIEGSVSMKSTVSGDTASTDMGKHTFAANGTTSGAINASEITLTSEKTYVTYEIELASTGDSYYAVLTESVSGSNLEVKYSTDGSTFVATNPTASKNFEVTGSEAKTIYVRYTIINTAKSVEVNGNISLSLTKTQPA